MVFRHQNLTKGIISVGSDCPLCLLFLYYLKLFLFLFQLLCDFYPLTGYNLIYSNYHHSREPFKEFVFPILAFLGSACLMVLVLRVEMISSGNAARVLSKYKLWMPPGLFDLLPKRSGGPERSHCVVPRSSTWVCLVNFLRNLMVKFYRVVIMTRGLFLLVIEGLCCPTY